jgi:hypothetical protein
VYYCVVNAAISILLVHRRAVVADAPATHPEPVLA